MTETSTSEKLYFFFYYARYEACGGFSDLISIHKTLPDALAAYPPHRDANPTNEQYGGYDIQELDLTTHQITQVWCGPLDGDEK